MEKIIEHLGDGVYASFEDNGITLMANDHLNPTDTIYLDSSVLSALNRFIVRCTEASIKETTIKIEPDFE
jgi:hypothetical protein